MSTPPYMNAAQVRQTFLEYFREHGHTLVPSSSLVPAHDPTLLFTNAGMVQFKDVFLGKERRDYVRAASSQRCVRAGGKHNDLENVGYTARHHTFFEMLGNFSFGDYFKREAIRFAWELLTERFQLDPERLWISVYREDEEAARIWTDDIGVRPERVARLGEASNFWSMGETGPCGPCTEIFWDHGPQVAGGPPGSADEGGDRYVEIWNLVFMQFERDAGGGLSALPKPSVDTGAGLERLAAVMQGVHSNYDIDLFRELIAAAASATGSADHASPSLRVIADHIRACGFLITDGVLPANEGRGYVLRRLIRRAARHGYKLGRGRPFFHLLVPALVHTMGEAYPELARAAEQVARVLQQEEERFAETLAAGMAQFEARMQGSAGAVVPGALIFLLHDTYGFPPDLTADIAREHHLQLDMAGYEQEMQQQRERARAASRFGVEQRSAEPPAQRTDFRGYEQLECEARVVGLYHEGEAVAQLSAGERGEVVLDRSPFYAEAGGQVGDTGELRGSEAVFIVEDTARGGLAHLHAGELARGTLRIGEPVQARVDAARREAIRSNHSATHLLHAALRKVLGTHVTQKGSLVAPDRLRFDFAHLQPMTGPEISEVERLVNAEIRANEEARTRVMDYEQALASGAMALFGEKYESRVRVLSIGEFSTELCGGTHVRRSGDIGLFHIVGESGVAAGVRRIEALTGAAAFEAIQRDEALLAEVASLMRGGRGQVADKVRETLEQLRRLERENRTLRNRLASGQGQDLAGAAVDVKGVKVVAARVPDADAAALRDAVDRLKSRLGSTVVVLGSVAGDSRVVLVAGVSGERARGVHAGELIGTVAAQVGGKGGGRADFAQAGGSRPADLDSALASVARWVQTRLTG